MIAVMGPADCVLCWLFIFAGWPLVLAASWLHDRLRARHFEHVDLDGHYRLNINKGRHW